MNKLLATGLAALVLISQSPMEAQRRTVAPRTHTQQAQQDTEFLSLYRQVSDLERKLAYEPPETGNRNYTETSIENEQEVKRNVSTWSRRISDVVLQTKYKEVVKLASRYAIDFNFNTTGIFTCGDSLVIEKFLEGYVILDQFSAIIAKNSWVAESREKYHYSYEILRAVPNPDSSFRVVSYGEVADGAIPLFETQDFGGIASKVRQLKKDNRVIYKDSLDSRNNVNQVPEFKGLNYDNTRSRFAYAQLINIGIMLLDMIEDSQELEGLPSPKKMQKAIPRVAGGRIILHASTLVDNKIGWDKADSKDPEERQKGWDEIRYEQSSWGEINLSIAPNKTVNYWFRRNCCIEDQTHAYRTLQINFPVK